MLRTLLLQVAKTEAIKNTMMSIPATRKVVQRFVAGETIDEMLPALRTLGDSNRFISIDNLGEDTTEKAQADAVVAQYKELLGALAAAGLADRAEVSIKLTALGMGLGSDGPQLAFDNATEICGAAEAIGTTVTVDMEDHTTTDITLETLMRLREKYPSTGAVIQAYLHRSESDCRDLAVEGSRVRLCKGAYLEPESVAYRKGNDIDMSYVRCLRTLMESPAYPMVASHDPTLIEIAQDLAIRNGKGVNDFEFQMLYGIREAEQQRLADLGHKIRVYVPYGTDWYGYLVRRLAERPANVTFFLRSFVSGK